MNFNILIIDGTYWIWKLIFVRSKGAIAVFAIEPAKAPQNRLITTVFTDVLIEAVAKKKKRKKNIDS